MWLRIQITVIFTRAARNVISKTFPTKRLDAPDVFLMLT
jgi:hypothetical protein